MSIKKPIHRGRKLYYDLQENIALPHNQSEEPTISTRGAALFILHRVIEETKYFRDTNEPSLSGVIQVLEEIGRRTEGYDIGPNIGYDEATGTLKIWGHPLTINPFKPQQRR